MTKLPIVKTTLMVTLLATAVHRVARAQENDAEPHFPVVLSNREFLVGFTDVEFGGPTEFKLQRVYNSITGFRSMFGIGWGCECETRLEPIGDGSIVIHEYGSGLQNVFESGMGRQDEIGRAAALLTDASIQKAAQESPNAAAKYERRLLTDGAFRRDEWHRLETRQEAENSRPASGTHLISFMAGFESIRVLSHTYERTHSTGVVDVFDSSGKLITTRHPLGYTLQFNYSNDGKLIIVHDAFGRWIRFHYTPSGVVDSAFTSGGRVAVFQYDSTGQLRYSRDVDGNEYRYEYDARSNMTSLGYSDSARVWVSYTGDDRVQTLLQRDGSAVRFTSDAPVDADSVTLLEIYRRVSPTEEHRIYFDSSFTRLTAAGDEWRWRRVQSWHGRLTTTLYKEIVSCYCHQAPITVRRDSTIEQFDYDAQGNQLRHADSNGITWLRRDVHTDQPVEVDRWTIDSTHVGDRTMLTYNGNRLITVVARLRDTIRLTYDASSGLLTAINRRQETLTIERNRIGNPSLIWIQSSGRMRLRYDSGDNVTSIQASGKRAVPVLRAMLDTIIGAVTPAMDGAESTLAALTALRDLPVDAHIATAAKLRKARKFRAAADEYRTAYAIDSMSNGAYQGLLAMLEDSLDDHAVAATTIRAWLRTHPKDYNALVALARSQLGAGAPDSSLMSLAIVDTASDLAPALAVAAHAIAVLDYSCLGRNTDVTNRVKAMRAYLLAQDARFRPALVAPGLTRHVNQASCFAVHRARFDAFLNALATGDRDDVFAASGLVLDNLSMSGRH